MKKPIACDLSVFPGPERIDHQNQSSALVRHAVRLTEAKDGFTFFHSYTSDKFVSFAKWITAESKCCPFLHFELALQPIDDGYEIAITLRGDEQIKDFLRSEFQGLPDRTLSSQ